MLEALGALRICGITELRKVCRLIERQAHEVIAVNKRFSEKRPDIPLHPV